VTLQTPKPPAIDELRTPRLVLRRWRDADRAPFAELNTDAEVMEFIGAPLTREQSDQWIDRIEESFASRRFGLWALEVHGGPPFVGFVGLSVPSFEAAFTPCVEVGWRLARHAWRHGYATEAARAAVTDGFERLGLIEIVSFTAVVNVRSQRVMQRLGMTRDPADDFDYPRFADGHPLRPHVLYRRRRT
jgi:RimJ/RimL family protein N-acetyltransferase